MYINAEDILQKVQQYIQGKEIYIPKKSEKKLGWGERNGSRSLLDLRNLQIAQDYAKGIPVESLMQMYHLSYDSIKRIVRKYKASLR